MIPVWPTRDSPSTSATSPSLPAEVVDRELRAHGVGAGRRRDVDDVARLETQLEVAHDRASERERPRRANRALGAAPVGAGEDLLGRQVRHMEDPALRLDAAAKPASAGWKEADGQIGAGPGEADRVEGVAVEHAAALPELVAVGAPGRDRVGLVETNRVGDCLPEPLEVGLAEHLLRLALGRERGDRPVDDSLVDRPHEDLKPFEGPRATDAALVDVGEELRLRVAGELDHRGAIEHRLVSGKLPGSREQRGPPLAR